MYRTVDARFWTDPKIRKLSPNGKLALLYLVTNPHSHVGGIYYLPTVTATTETGLPRREWDRVCDTLSDLRLAQFDAETDVVWVVNMFKYQARGEKNERAVVANMATLHNSRLIPEFVAKYPAMKRYGIDTLSNPSPAQDQTRTPDQDQDQEQDSVENTPSSKDPNDPGWLAREWLIRVKRTKNAHDEGAADFFGELIRIGVKPSAILEEIKRETRNRTEPIWEIGKRLAKLATTKAAGDPDWTDPKQVEAFMREQADKNRKAREG